MCIRDRLFTEPKGSDQVYLTTLGGSLEDNVVVLSTDATADDGTTGSVLTTSGTYKTDRVSLSLIHISTLMT